MAGMRSIHNLALIGFMGTGKSGVGRVAADLMHFTFLDTDHVIEARAGKAVSDIFAQDGEPAFRQWERRIVEELTRRQKTVIATGGGLPMDEANLASLKTHKARKLTAAGASRILSSWKSTGGSTLHSSRGSGAGSPAFAV
jgi:shikimate kinase